MRQINFFFIFILSLALVLFGIENTSLTTIQLVPGIQLQAPLSIELIVATGLGALFAWLYSIWTRLQVMLISAQQLKQQESKIHELEQNVEQYKAEIQSLQMILPPAKNSLATETQTVEVVTS